MLGMARELGLLKAGAGSNYFYPLMGIYAEYAASLASDVWGDLVQQPDGPGSARSHKTIEILRKAFHLPTLCAVQVARFLQLADKTLFDAAV